MKKAMIARRRGIEKLRWLERYKVREVERCDGNMIEEKMTEWR